MAEVTPEERVQKVKADLLEDLEFEPAQIRQFFTTNIFSRVFAHLVGWTGKKARMLRCTSAGELKTAPTTTGIESYNAANVTGGDDWSGTYSFPVWVSRVDMFISDNPIEIQFKIAGGGWGSAIQIPVGFYSVDMRAKDYRFKNKTAGNVSLAQLIGWW